MTIRDKNGALGRLSSIQPLVIELGCGPRKRHAGSIGIDVIDSDAVDIVGDAIEVLRSFPDGVADLVTSSHFLEHVPDLQAVLHEIVRVTRTGGRVVAVVPHFAHPYFYSDPTHIHHFGLYTFSYFADDQRFRRRVPEYSRLHGLYLVDADLVFKSSPPFYFRHGVKKAVGFLFNSCRYMQELWEENFCFLFPCFEVRFVLEKRER
ncbi:MAG TPA: methyltransferase domain-containing protein [Gemmatimonadaceae bacterium]